MVKVVHVVIAKSENGDEYQLVFDGDPTPEALRRELENVDPDALEMPDIGQGFGYLRIAYSGAEPIRSCK